VQDQLSGICHAPLRSPAATTARSHTWLETAVGPLCSYISPSHLPQPAIRSERAPSYLHLDQRRCNHAPGLGIGRAFIVHSRAGTAELARAAPPVSVASIYKARVVRLRGGSMVLTQDRALARLAHAMHKLTREEKLYASRRWSRSASRGFPVAVWLEIPHCSGISGPAAEELAGGR
jgi:hypothetical protein